MKNNQLQGTDAAAPRSEYIRLLCELHDLMKRGQEGTAEINQVRDEMDLPGEQLSDLEIEQMHGLSADLYDLAEITLPASPPNHLKNDASSLRLWNAYVESNWEALLREVRAQKSQLALERMIVLRAYAWAHLDGRAPLLAFLHGAAQLAIQGCADQLSFTGASAAAPSAANSPRLLRERRDAARASRGELIDLMPGTGSVNRRCP